MHTMRLRFVDVLVAAMSIVAGASTQTCAAEAVPGQWGTTDSSNSDQIQWPATWLGAKNLRAQWFKIFCDHPEIWKWEHHAKGEPPTSTYFLWRGDQPVPEGTKLLLEGDFPHARFFSLQIGAPWSKEQPALGDGSGIPEVPLLDEDIEPDAGSINPFRAGADRNATKRHYHVTFELRDGNAETLNPKAMLPPYRAPGNLRIGGTRTGKSGEYGPYLWVRIYLPDRYEPYCGVEPPVLRIQYPGKEPELAPIVRRINLNLGRFLPDFKLEENPAREDGFSVKEMEVNNFLEDYARKGNEAAGPPLANFSESRLRYMSNRDGTVAINKSFTTFRYVYSRRPPPEKYGSVSKEEWLYGQLPKIIKYVFGMGPDMPPPGNDEHNSDHNDFGTYLAGGVMMPPGKCLVISGTLPKTPRTLAGNPVAEPSDELRYFGLLLQSGEPLPITPVVAVHDEQLVLDKDRHYTIVVSTKEDRPKNVTSENGFTWREWPVGSRLSMLIRVVSTNPHTWSFAPQHIPWEVCDLTSRQYDPYHVQKHMQQYAPVGRYLGKGEIEAMKVAGRGPYQQPPVIPLTEKNRFPRVSGASPAVQQSETKPAPATTASAPTTVAPRGPSRPTSPVDTSAGPITGEEQDGVRSFKGIPFAAPPVGELRWKPPQAVEPWATPRACVKFGPACPQRGKDLFGPVGEMSEDCLYLNLWTPAKSAEDKLPVMFWIHGGGFMFGSGGKACYDGAELARRGRVVVVTCNYRLGPFGFLAHPALTAESPNHASGNYGMMDQVAALQWVQKNITEFGGDSGCVTIFGQSAGGVSVCALMASPLAKGFFHRAIVHSGSAPGNLHERAAMEALGEEFARRLGTDDLKAMRAKSTSEALAAAKKGSGRVGEGTQDHLSIDGYVLPESLRTVFAEGRQHNVPLMAGTTKDEGSLFLAGEKAVIQAMAAIQPKTYSYEFRRTPRYAAAKHLGAFHGVELPYLFHYFLSLFQFTADDERLSEQIIGYWTRFARTGDPNGEGALTWLPYDANSQKVQPLDIGGVGERY